MCSAYEFYPPHIKVSWLRDGKPVTSEVTSTMEMADDPSLLEYERNKVAIGASGLVLGIIITATGLIYFKKKSTGRALVPQ
ncbi:hypothetical protein cypCar_00044678 [Cyprinus carpio]|nr:hypothetical protein cypCar_00044678 [Cyprinus carpio]